MSANSVDDIGTMPTLPLLREGDRLTADEFHRRYEGMPYLKNANLVDGVVYMSSPIHTHHSGAHFDVIGWLAPYRYSVVVVAGHDNVSWRIDGQNEVQPDAILCLDAAHDGAVVDGGRLLRGVPELVVEVAVSSARADAGPKRALYERTGVQEYVLWRVRDDRLDWWALTDGSYQPLPADENGVIKSVVFPGLWLDVPALIADDMPRVMATRDAGLGSLEHHAFAARLRQV